jgi:hypothetical protein
MGRAEAEWARRWRRLRRRRARRMHWARWGRPGHVRAAATYEELAVGAWHVAKEGRRISREIAKERQVRLADLHRPISPGLAGR